MRKKYIAIECENSKYCKDVPYISKKEFRKNEDNVIVGKTRLKKYKSSSEKKELDSFSFNIFYYLNCFCCICMYSSS